MLKHELRNLLSGTGKTKQKNLIHAISGYFTGSKATGQETKVTKHTKQEEAGLITKYVNLPNCFKFSTLAKAKLFYSSITQDLSLGL